MHSMSLFWFVSFWIWSEATHLCRWNVQNEEECSQCSFRCVNFHPTIISKVHVIVELLFNRHLENKKWYREGTTHPTNCIGETIFSVNNQFFVWFAPSFIVRSFAQTDQGGYQHPEEVLQHFLIHLQLLYLKRYHQIYWWNQGQPLAPGVSTSKYKVQISIPRFIAMEQSSA